MERSKTICETGSYTVKKGKLKIVLPLVKKFVETVKKKEKGTLVYVAFQSKENPLKFVHFMVFKDKKANKLHSSTEYVKKFASILYPNCTKKPVFKNFNNI